MLDWLLRRLGLRRPKCAHRFRGVDMVKRNAAGIVVWPCCQCDFVAHVEYGLQVQDFGTITGPWGAKEDTTHG